MPCRTTTPERPYSRVPSSEFELVKNALFIDPNDQSGWLYHRWLVGDGSDTAVLAREVGVISEILEIAPDSKCMLGLESLSHAELRIAQGAWTPWCTISAFCCCAARRQTSPLGR